MHSLQCMHRCAGVGITKKMLLASNSNTFVPSHVACCCGTGRCASSLIPGLPFSSPQHLHTCHVTSPPSLHLPPSPSISPPLPHVSPFTHFLPLFFPSSSRALCLTPFHSHSISISRFPFSCLCLYIVWGCPTPYCPKPLRPPD